MGQLKNEEVLKKGTEVKTVKQFAELHNVEAQAIYYAIKHDLVDWFTVSGDNKYIVMTSVTKAYKPNEHVAREKKNTRKKKKQK